MPVLSLKNLKMSQGQETLFFSVSLYVNGERAASVSNSGTGGSHRWSWFDDNSKKVFKDYVAKLESENYFEYPFEHDDHVIDEMIIEKIDYLELQKLCKKKTVFTVKPDTTPRYIDTPYSQGIITHLTEKYGDRVEFLNDKFSKPKK